MTVLDLNRTATLREAFSAKILAQVDRALEAEAESPRAYVGASAVGDECARRVQLELWPSFHPDKPIIAGPIAGKTRRVFARGNRLEVNVADWLRGAGYDLATVKPDGYPFGFITGQGQIRGHVDGIIRGGDDALDYPLVWENKVVGAKGWKSVASHGVLKAYPKYDAQAQLYMAYLDMQATLFSFLNADTMDLWFELVPFSAERAQAASDRAVAILQATRAGDLLGKAAGEADAFPCGWCRFKSFCWEGL